MTCTGLMITTLPPVGSVTDKKWTSIFFVVAQTTIAEFHARGLRLPKHCIDWETQLTVTRFISINDTVNLEGGLALHLCRPG